MKALQALGVQLSIDDFGTGYSSLSALKTFPVARLKIDKSFIDGLPANESDKAVASAVISLGQKLNLKVIAEGVETTRRSRSCAKTIATKCKATISAGRSRRAEIEGLLRAARDAGGSALAIASRPPDAGA